MSELMTAETHQDYIDGYTDGRDPSSPEPNANRSERYKHSFNVGRAEIEGRPISFKSSMRNVERVEREENERL